MVYDAFKQIFSSNLNVEISCKFLILFGLKIYNK